MSPLDSFVAAGYAVVPARGGRPIVGGMFAGRYHYTPGAERFADFDVGLVCAGLPIPGASGRGDTQEIHDSRASGAGTLRAIASTWIAAIRWTSHNTVLSKEIDTLVNTALGGNSPAYIDGNTVTRLARVEQPISPRRIAPVHFSAEPWKSVAYVPHRFEIVSRGGWVVLGRDAKPTPRSQLPVIDGGRADALITAVETAFIKRGALPWV